MRQQTAIYKNNSEVTWFDKCEDYFYKSWYFTAQTWILSGKCKDKCNKKVVNEYRAKLIASMLDSSEGRTALAQAMVAPIQRVMYVNYDFNITIC